MKQSYDVIVIGGGQAGLALGYYLRKSSLRYVILDAEEKPGGAWQHTWDSLQLFSPAQWSSLPGTLLEGGTEQYPTKPDIIKYLKDYEKKYGLNIQRPVTIKGVRYEKGHYILTAENETFSTRALICATGTFRQPKIPDLPGISDFSGEVIHSSSYTSPESFEGQQVGIVGEGNSGAQMLAELSRSANVYWLTKNKPDFLPDHVDGKYLFDAATQLYAAKKKGKDYIPPSLGDIVMVPSVKEARSRGVYDQYFTEYTFTEKGFFTQDGAHFDLDAIILCTGYSPAIAFLKELPISFQHQKVKTYGTRAKEIDGLWMVGYGSWTGFASATVIGVGRSARQTIKEVTAYLQD